MIRTIDLSDRAPLRRIWVIAGAWGVVTFIQAITLRFQEDVRFDYALVSAAMNYSIMALLVWASCRINVRRRLGDRSPLRAATGGSRGTVSLKRA